jgi:hypothetical protein
MRCNQKFFGQEHFESGTPERAFCTNLGILKPAMSQYGFAVKDHLPQLPSNVGGIVQVKYNGMMSVVMWDEKRGGFVAWGPRGRCYYSLADGRKHPVTEFFNTRLSEFRDLAFIAETYVVRKIGGKNFMTDFNYAMSIIKNPRSAEDVDRIKLAVFDYVKIKEDGGFDKSEKSYIDRFKKLRDVLNFPVGCDNGVVHLPDYLEIEGSFQNSFTQIQDFWNKYIGERRFEGLVMHTNNGEEYKIKFRDTLDVAIIAFRMTGNSRPKCEKCGAKFDALWLRKYVREGLAKRSEWFDPKGRLLKDKAENGIWVMAKNLVSCPICAGPITTSAGPVLGAKIALMSPDGNFVDIADGAQISPISPILDLIEPLYEDDGYLWVKPEVVIEVSYQGDQLYIDRKKPVYQFDGNRYTKVGTMKATSLRPYRARLRDDKTVNPQDLRLEQLNYFVDRVKEIRSKWQKARQQGSLVDYLKK